MWAGESKVENFGLKKCEDRVSEKCFWEKSSTSWGRTESDQGVLGDREGSQEEVSSIAKITIIGREIFKAKIWREGQGIERNNWTVENKVRLAKKPVKISLKKV